MTVGESIRLHRKKQNLTQGQLAALLSVSVQAVSKWETDAGMPDVSLVIPLANALHITTDELLCNRNRREEVEKLWKSTLREYGEMSTELHAVTEAALSEFPKDKTFLYRFAVEEEWLAERATDERERDRRLGGALWHIEQLLQIDPADEVAKEMQVRLHAALGQYDRAVRLAYLCENSDRALKYCLQGEALQRHRERLIQKRMHELIGEVCWRNGDKYMEIETVLQKALAECEAVLQKE